MWKVILVGQFWHLATETKTYNFISTEFNVIQQCIGVHIRRDYCYVLRDSAFKVFLRDTSVPKQLSFSTQEEKDVLSYFVSKVEREAQHVGVTLCTQLKLNI